MSYWSKQWDKHIPNERVKSAIQSHSFVQVGDDYEQNPNVWKCSICGASIELDEFEWNDFLWYSPRPGRDPWYQINTRTLPKTCRQVVMEEAIR